MKVIDKINEIKSIDNNCPQIYICSRSSLSTRCLKRDNNGDVGYLTFNLKSFARDELLESDKEVVCVEQEKTECIDITLDYKCSNSYINSYFIFVKRLSKNNKGRTIKESETIVKPKNKVRYCL